MYNNWFFFTKYKQTGATNKKHTTFVGGGDCPTVSRQTASARRRRWSIGLPDRIVDLHSRRTEVQVSTCMVQGCPIMHLIDAFSSGRLAPADWGLHNRHCLLQDALFKASTAGACPQSKESWKRIAGEREREKTQKPDITNNILRGFAAWMDNVICRPGGTILSSRRLT